MENIKLPKGLLLVDNPDHPFTYDNPDFLLSNRKGLLAVFKIRENELKNPNKLFNRLTNSIIAYPPYTKMLLLIENNKNYPNVIEQFWKKYFNEYIEIKDLKRSNLLIKDSKPLKIIKEIKNIQKRIFRVQSQVQNDNLYFYNKSKFEIKEIKPFPELKEKAKFYDSIINKERIVRANIYKYDNQFIAVKKLSKNISDIKELVPYFEFVINSEFFVDYGVPNFKFLSRKAINLNNIPSLRYDPLKPTRIASLFGWHISNADNLQNLLQRIEKYRK